MDQEGRGGKLCQMPPVPQKHRTAARIWSCTTEEGTDLGAWLKLLLKLEEVSAFLTTSGGQLVSSGHPCLIDVLQFLRSPGCNAVCVNV